MGRGCTHVPPPLLYVAHGNMTVSKYEEAVIPL